MFKSMHTAVVRVQLPLLLTDCQTSTRRYNLTGGDADKAYEAFVKDQGGADGKDTPPFLEWMSKQTVKPLAS